MLDAFGQEINEGDYVTWYGWAELRNVMLIGKVIEDDGTSDLMVWEICAIGNLDDILSEDLTGRPDWCVSSSENVKVINGCPLFDMMYEEMKYVEPDEFFDHILTSKYYGGE